MLLEGAQQGRDSPPASLMETLETGHNLADGKEFSLKETNTTIVSLLEQCSPGRSLDQ